MNDENSLPTVVQHADDAYEALRAIAHTASDYPAPLAYSMLGNLKYVGYNMNTVCTIVARGLETSLKTYEVYDAEGQDPAENVAKANRHLKRAAELAEQLAQELEAAQSAITDQGYRD